MKINNYQSFYVGSEEHNQYGNLSGNKDTIVKYEFNTTDKDGNKVMDKLSKKETMELLNSVGNQYGDNVIVEFSGDALDILKEGISKEKNMETNEAYIKELEERNALFQAEIKPAQKLHLIIPNIQTNDKLEKSLAGLEQNIVDAAYSIIQTDLLPHNIGNMNEEERQNLLSLGLEKAKYLAENMDTDKSTQFMEAMETIAKYGMSGKTDNQGNVRYNIQQGPKVGVSDDYISDSDLMKKIAPKEYETFSKMWGNAFDKDDNSLKIEAFRYLHNWAKNASTSYAKEIAKEKENFATWKKDIDDIKIENKYENVDRTSINNFITSIQKNNSSSHSYFSNSLEKFKQFFQKE